MWCVLWLITCVHIFTLLQWDLVEVYHIITLPDANLYYNKRPVIYWSSPYWHDISARGICGSVLINLSSFQMPRSSRQRCVLVFLSVFCGLVLFNSFQNTSYDYYVRTDHNNTNRSNVSSLPTSVADHSEASAIPEIDPLPWYIRNGSVRPLSTMVITSGRLSFFCFLGF